MTSSQPPEEKKVQTIPTASARLPQGDLLEMVYDPDEGTTRFIVGNGEAWTYETSLSLSPTERLVPYSPSNNLVKHGVVLFPSEPEEYGTEADLLSRIRAFLHRYVDMEEDFEEIAAYYALFTWIYDAFHEVPYVRVRGGYGTGNRACAISAQALRMTPVGVPPAARRTTTADRVLPILARCRRSS